MRERHLLSTAARGQFRQVRAYSVGLTKSLSDADASAQSMPDASPAKWHLAHTTWFFETFVLRDFLAGYRLFDARLPFLFNSYYEAEGARIPRASRGLLTRPSMDDVSSYRAHVDEAIERLLDDASPEAAALIELGCHHEQQHQELLLTDILHLFAQNPLAPALWPSTRPREVRAARPLEARAPTPITWVRGREGPTEIGHGGAGFAFDCEGPRHTEWLQSHRLADRLVTNGEWRAFMRDGGYRTAGLWLSDGWAWVRESSIEAPLYWRRADDGEWALQFGLDGLTAIDPAEPVSHISYYEADAFARWAGARLPTEAEWESAAESLDPSKGTFADAAEAVRPHHAPSHPGLRQMFGDLWEWTGSAYRPHPGFRAAPGGVGEYNGKFMSGQFVLKGGSCVTPRGHLRASYRNFFYPHQRWQFMGLRLAKDD
ncbi:MAG: ergothioneine biosynthesis protein EgtB [Steroidobacteraceae bacterium]